MDKRLLVAVLLSFVLIFGISGCVNPPSGASTPAAGNVSYSRAALVPANASTYVVVETRAILNDPAIRRRWEEAARALMRRCRL